MIPTAFQPDREILRAQLRCASVFNGDLKIRGSGHNGFPKIIFLSHMAYCFAKSARDDRLFLWCPKTLKDPGFSGQYFPESGQ